jgi:predicted acyltransferase
VLAGFLAARYVRERGRNYHGVFRLLLVGGLCVIAALAWNSVFPINKKLWTSSYVLCATGIDLWVLALLVFLVELRTSRGWPWFFEVLGKNTLFIYLLSEVGNTVMVLTPIGNQSLFVWLYARVFQPLAGEKNGALLYALAYMMCCWLVAYAMDRRRIYIKL